MPPAGSRRVQRTTTCAKLRGRESVAQSIGAMGAQDKNMEGLAIDTSEHNFKAVIEDALIRGGYLLACLFDVKEFQE